MATLLHAIAALNHTAKDNSSRMPMLTIRVTPEFRQRFNAIARRHEISTNQLARLVLERAAGELEAEAAK